MRLSTFVPGWYLIYPRIPRSFALPSFLHGGSFGVMADLSFAWLFWLVIRWPILREQIKMQPMMKDETNVPAVFSRSTALRRASFSATLIFGLVAILARISGEPFPPLQWAGIVI